jgi:hypothetical protein
MGEQYEVGLVNVGVSVVDATLVLMNATVQTDAQFIASAPNTGVGAACGPIVHSLGIAPKACFIQPKGGSLGTGRNFLFMTADASAGYFRATAWTQNSPGVSVRMIAIR